MLLMLPDAGTTVLMLVHINEELLLQKPWRPVLVVVEHQADQT